MPSEKADAEAYTIFPSSEREFGSKAGQTRDHLCPVSVSRHRPGTDLIREEIERRKRQEAQIRSLRSRKERLLDVIENGVPMKSVFQRVAEMEAEIERLSDLPVLPAVNDSEASIKRPLANAPTLTDWEQVRGCLTRASHRMGGRQGSAAACFSHPPAIASFVG